MLGLCASAGNNNDEDCEKKLADMLNDIQAVRGSRASDFKGLAQRFRQLTRQLPPAVRAGYVEQYTNRQRGLRDKIKDYKDSGCGDPPALVTDWANKSVPAPVSPKDFTQKMSEITGLTGTALATYLIVSEGSRFVFPPRNLVPIP